MHVVNVLRAKGAEVATVHPAATVADAVGELHRRGIGALVVSADGAHVDGILSERDVVRCLAEGADQLGRPVASVMTADVETCSPDDRLEQLMTTMTQRRIRHLPVVVDGRLAGIVSIGDVVKLRLEQLAAENEHLHDYVTGAR